jgi:hypothetical protein
MLGGGPCAWTCADDYLEVKPGTGDLVTKERFADFELHLEFWLPHLPDKTSQARANSGLYLQGLYEVQVLDSYGNETYPMGECGALYLQKAPLANANLPPERWQTYRAIFRPPGYDVHGRRMRDGSLSLWFNGTLVHDATPITEPTGGAMGHGQEEPGPIRLQDHGDLVRFRNIWIRPLEPCA